MSEEKKRFFAAILFMITAFVVLISAVPQRDVFLVKITGFLPEVVRAIVVFLIAIIGLSFFVICPGVLGVLAHLKLVPAIDQKMGFFSRFTIYILGALTTGALLLAGSYLAAAIINWIGIIFHWPPIVTESPNDQILFGIAGFGIFTIGWAITTGDAI